MTIFHLLPSVFENAFSTTLSLLMIPPPGNSFADHGLPQKIYSEPSTTSFALSLPSLKPDENPNKAVHPLQAPAEVLSSSVLGMRTSSIPTKRKWNSSPRSVNVSQLHEAQERVEQKRAKIAARVPSSTVPGPTQGTITSLADLYSQMRRDSGASIKQETSSVLPRTLSASEQGAVHRPQKLPSSASSPDPIAMGEDDNDIVMLRHVRPSSHEARARFKPIARLAPSSLLKPFSKAKLRTSTPEKRSQGSISAGATLQEKANVKVQDPVALHPSHLNSRSVRPSETITDLGAVPILFDFSLSHHLPTPNKGEGVERNDGSSLWWHNPSFEARAKADIRRTLRDLLPADTGRDPPPPGGGTDGWRAEVRPRQPRERMWAERLEDAFGPGPLDRGIGRKPRRIAVSTVFSVQLF
ncbi:hypothetical protein F5148DRAFT_1285522 [Russula earlei]|uniref:Uncharacterized protein n=1 Tax=Russula earlei TaxID=71964 RepID=A0ACC0U7Y6_9AGAM|nr:hypothetical protein F5148DRAFT_1285522 [Russula earlei]